LSDPAANIRPVPDNKLAAPNPDKIGTDVLIKSLRETPSLFSFALLFMSNPFNENLLLLYQKTIDRCHSCGSRNPDYR
jgi:hypothetical protein